MFPFKWFHTTYYCIPLNINLADNTLFKLKLFKQKNVRYKKNERQNIFMYSTSNGIFTPQKSILNQPRSFLT